LPAGQVDWDGALDVATVIEKDPGIANEG